MVQIFNFKIASYVCPEGWLGWLDSNQRKCQNQNLVPYRLGYSPVYIVGWVVGFEPTTSRITIWRSNQLNYTHQTKMARQERLELPTLCLEGRCSIQLSYWRKKINMERVMGIEPTRPAWKAGILAIELHPHVKAGSHQPTLRLYQL